MELLSTVTAAAMMGLGSTAHCVTMCGPLATAACGSTDDSSFRRVPAAYLLGRLAGYALTGAAAGALGGSALRAVLGPRVHEVTALCVAGALAWTALRLLRAQTRAEPPLVPLRRRREGGAALVTPALGVGLATALLPCGALFGALLLAATAGDAGSGSLAMVSFATTSGLSLAALLFAGQRLRNGALGRWCLDHRRVVAVALLVVAAGTAARPFLRGGTNCRCYREGRQWSTVSASTDARWSPPSRPQNPSDGKLFRTWARPFAG